MLVLDSSEFEFNKKTEPISAGMFTQKSTQGSAISPVSINSISQTSKKTIKNHILLKALCRFVKHMLHHQVRNHLKQFEEISIPAGA